MSRIAYVNGRYIPHAQAMIHVEDRGYQFADGVYEVIALHNGQFLDEQGHMERLQYSLSELSITAPMARKPMMSILREVVRQNRRSAAAALRLLFPLSWGAADHSSLHRADVY